MVGKQTYSLSVLKPLEMDNKKISAWADLESRSIEANAFLSPFFILPAIRYLEAKAKILVLFVERIISGSSDVVGVGVFKICKPSKHFPLPHLAAFRSIHSYLSGLLVDKDYAIDVLHIMFNYLSQPGQNWHGIMFEKHSSEGALAELENSIATEYGMKWSTYRRSYRAILYPAECGESNLSLLSMNLQRNYRRWIRKLEKVGEIDWKFARGDELNDANIDQLIKLEDMGWKGKQGTSLNSQPNHALFFREMIQGFNQVGRAFFTELYVGGNLIASQSNLISGNAGFRFKIGWNTAYAEFAPGMVNEIKGLLGLYQYLDELEFIDSGSSERAFINRIWLRRRSLHDGIYSKTKSGKLIAYAIQFALKLKNRLSKKRFLERVQLKLNEK